MKLIPNSHEQPFWKRSLLQITESFPSTGPGEHSGMEDTSTEELEDIASQMDEMGTAIIVIKDLTK